MERERLSMINWCQKISSVLTPYVKPNVLRELAQKKESALTSLVYTAPEVTGVCEDVHKRLIFLYLVGLDLKGDAQLVLHKFFKDYT